MDTHGNILVQLDEENKIDKSKDKIISYALNCHEEYIETFKYHDFLPNRPQSLVYTLPVRQSDDKNSKTIGILSLCFRFKDEMKSIFEHELLPASFIAKEDIQDRFKKLSMKGFFNMSFNGVALNVELTHTYKDICDALYS